MAVVNFAAFFCVGIALGGDALSGKIEDGRYYLKSKGRYTEVAEAVWHFSRIHTISVIVTHPVGILVGGVLLTYSRRHRRRT